MTTIDESPVLLASVDLYQGQPVFGGVNLMFNNPQVSKTTGHKVVLPRQSGNINFDVVQPTPAITADAVSMPHSCDSNCVFVEGRVVAMRDIPKGTQLTINVNLAIAEIPDEDAYDCNCQASNCVGRVGGHQMLPFPEVQRLMMVTEPWVRNVYTGKGGELESEAPYYEIRPNGGMGLAMFAKQDIPADTDLYTAYGLVIPFPTMYTVVVARGRHLLFAGGAQCFAHSCQPNIRIVPDGDTYHCVTIRPIAKDESIAFNYLSTEYEMRQPFQCLCGSEKCFGMISGYKLIAKERRSELDDIVTSAVLEQAAEETLGDMKCEKDPLAHA
jgi:hypothetical protein